MLRNKKNKFRDRRLGQYSKHLTHDQKAEKRFIALRKNIVSSRNRKFLLNDNEEKDDLNLLADRLTEAEKFQRNGGGRGGDNDDDEIDQELFAAASFGGGTLRASNAAFNAKGEKKSRKEMLDEIIAGSKQQKMLKQRERSAQLDQWERLNEQFSELKQTGELAFGRAAEAAKGEEDQDYAMLYQQLESGKRATALEPQRKSDAAKKTATGDDDDDEEESDDEAQTSDGQEDGEEDEQEEDEEEVDEALAEQVQHAVAGLANVIEDMIGKRKINEIEMLEPRFDERYDTIHPSKRRADPLTRVRRLKQRVRRETRTAVREFRGDARAVAGAQAVERRKESDERRTKTNKILGLLQGQESEYKKRKLTGKKKKF